MTLNVPISTMVMLFPPFTSNLRDCSLGPNHPMKPHRLALTHTLVVSYDLTDHMKVSFFVRHQSISTGIQALSGKYERHGNFSFARIRGILA